MTSAVYEIPEKIVNFGLYNDSEKQVGVTGEVKLPSIEFKTVTVDGAGIGGEYESPTPGHSGSIEIEIPYRLVGAQPLELMKNKYTTLFMRGVKQLNDISGGGLVNKPLKITVKGLPKSIDLGKFAPSSVMETAAKLEVLYIKIETDDLVILEYDKLNLILIINGEDQLAEIRSMM